MGNFPFTAATAAGTQPWQFTPEAKGAKRDGQAVMDGAMASGGNTVTCATSAPFRPGDVTKLITVEGAGTQFAGTSTPSAGSGTITGYLSPTQVTVSFTASGNVSGRTVIWGTDDTAALNASVAAGALYAAANRYFFEWVLGAGIYMAGGPLIQGGASKTNSQIPFPVVGIASNPTMVMKITGTRCNSGPQMFAASGDTPMAAVEGTVIYSTLVGQAYSGTFGQPAVLGGPTVEQGYTGGFTNLWNNLMVVVDGLSVLVPPVASLTGIDMTSCGKAEVIWARAFAAAPQPILTGANYNPVWTGGQSFPKGMVLPQGGNNAHVMIGSFGCEGLATGVYAYEQATIHELSTILCGVGMSCDGHTAGHNVTVFKWTTEANNTHLNIPAGNSIGVNIVSMNAENISQWTAGAHIQDAGNFAHGRIGLNTSQAIGTITINGGANLEVIYDYMAATAGAAARGFSGPQPAVPASGTPAANPGGKHATVYVTSGGAAVTAISITDAAGTTATGLTLGTTGTVMVRVPAQSSVSWTGAGAAPTWKWDYD